MEFFASPALQWFHSLCEIWGKNAGETVLQLRTHSALTKDLSLGPGTHMRWLTSPCNSSSRRPKVPDSGYCSNVYKDTHVHIIKNNKIDILKRFGYYQKVFAYVENVPCFCFVLCYVLS